MLNAGSTGEDHESQPSTNGRSATRTLIRFGVFELDVETGELRRQGARLRLQDKPRQVLLALLERPGEIVGRKELQQRLWPGGVFVDFESGLNTAANRLRIALGDAASSPRFVETLPRLGYRFIAPIERVEVPRLKVGPDPVPPSGLHHRMLLATAVVSIFVVGLTAALIRRDPQPDGFQFRPITFSRGNVLGARFGPGGAEVLYDATWNGGPLQIFATRPGSREPRALDVNDRRLVAVSRTGNLALLDADGTLPIAGGTLLRASATGGAPQIVQRNVMAADWWGGDDQFAWALAVDGVNRLELPGKRFVHQTSGWIGGIRSAPDGLRLAFIDHPVRHDDGGGIKLVDRDGSVRTLADGWTDIGGMAWHPDGREIWFSATRDASPKAIWAVAADEAPTVRLVTRAAGSLSLRDIAPDGRLLVSTETARLEMAVLGADGRPRDITLNDWSRVADISSDGRLVLFDESGAAGGSDYLVYTRRLDTGETRHLGSGRAMALAPGNAVLTLDARDPRLLRLVSLSDTTTRVLPASGLEYQWVRYFPDGRTLLALANEPGQPLRVFVQPADGRPFPLTPPTMVRNAAISPDGRRVAMLAANNALVLYPVSEHARPEPVPGGQNLAPLLWAGEWLYVQHLGKYTQIPTRLSRLHVASGRLEPWGSVAPGDSVGVNAITKVMVGPDQRTVVFNYRRVLSELFIGAPGHP